MKIPFKGIACVFMLLLMAKIVISGVYLQLDNIQVSTSNLALAEDKGGAVPSDDRPLGLKNKEDELKERERRLKAKEEELVPLKKEVEAKVAELNELQATLAAFAKELAEREKALRDAKIAHLVSLYGAMDPSKAAAIMDKLKIDTVVRILGNMKGKSAGQILAMMKPEKGALISEKLSQPE
jgi:flagellar motility protein MotE (MotC chaperone)